MTRSLLDDQSRDEWTVREVATEIGVGRRTLRAWSAFGLVEAPPFRGAKTSYGRAQVERLVAIRKLREAGLGLGEIKARLAAEEAVKAERARLAEEEAAAKAAAAAEAPQAEREARAEVKPAERAGYPAERWERVVLIPGLELFVNGAGGAILRRLAAEIYAQYGAGTPAESP